jgi:hypothetical protein
MATALLADSVMLAIPIEVGRANGYEIAIFYLP